MKAKNLRFWAQAPKLAWSMALIGSASAGLFMGLGAPAHSDVSKFNALLAQHERLPRARTSAPSDVAFDEVRRRR